MMMPLHVTRIIYVLTLLLSNPQLLSGEERVDFDRQIRPILSDNCFSCHGPDESKREAGLRLDLEDSAKAYAIESGDPEASEIHVRIWSEDEDVVMPPTESKLELSKKEKQLLDRWIAQGADYDAHWSFVAPQRPQSPEVDAAHRLRLRNGIDHFVVQQLENAGLRLAAEADRATLIRRVTLDLTGLPPTVDEIEDFLNDTSGDAYERVVERLLDSPHYGERMALVWLDAARYADSAGYQNDFRRSQWPWRDWVIQAYNHNMRFNDFSIQQLAGDLLPERTAQQLLATAFNRNHRINNEGGIIPEEFLVEYVADRVETTSTVWLGLTVGCARCHDHKYDPISQTEFYRMFAFFHNIPENGKDGEIAPPPNMAVVAERTEAEHSELQEKVKLLATQKAEYFTSHQDNFEEWLASQHSQLRKKLGSRSLPAARLRLGFDYLSGKSVMNLGQTNDQAAIMGPRNRVVFRANEPHGKSITFATGGYIVLPPIFGQGGYDPTMPMSWTCRVRGADDIGNVEGPIISCVTPDKRERGYQIVLVDPGDQQPFQIAFRLNSDREMGNGLEVKSAPVVPRTSWSQLSVTYDGSLRAAGVQIYLDGKRVESSIEADRLKGGFTTHADTLLGGKSVQSSQAGIRDDEFRGGSLDDVEIYRQQLNAKQVQLLTKLSNAERILASERLTTNQRTWLEQHYFSDRNPHYEKLSRQHTAAEARLRKFEEQHVTYVSVMDELETPRQTWLLARGAYDQPDKSEAPLSPDTFSALPPMGKLPRNRLGLAKWLFQEDHPLTARVAVNRYWQMYFGTGLVDTPEDFGMQGARPTHPRLLDWLAVEFRESGWNIKAMQKLIVMSATYRQSSKVTPSLLRKDPDNRLLARGPRFRLYGQAIRDQALAASGLLVRQIGGPPVMPYQPEGLWEEVSAKGYKYVVEDGAGLYRRSLYTFWRRTVPPPSMMNFDNAGREVCSVRSSRTNTPLQAMNLLNDPQFVEAARALAERMMTEGGVTLDEQLNFGYRTVLSRNASAPVLSILRAGFDDYRIAYARDPQAASALTHTGNSVPSADSNLAELAAYTTVANILLNLDATVTKE